MVSGVFREGIILLPLKGVVDFAAEKERLKKELDNLNKYLEGYARKLSNPSFVERAPAKVVEEEKRRQAEAMENKAKIEEALQRIANFWYKNPLKFFQGILFRKNVSDSKTC